MITHPDGYTLDKQFVRNARVEKDQNRAFEGADFIYAKNWSSTEPYGEVLCTDTNWTVTAEKMELTNNARFLHCLPVRRNVVVTDSVLDGPSSLVIEQAKKS